MRRPTLALAAALALAVVAGACGGTEAASPDSASPAGVHSELPAVAGEGGSEGATTLPPVPTTRALPDVVAPPPAAPVALPPTGDLAPVVSRVPTTDRVVFLTIDDGLVRDPAALDVLVDQRIPFSNFLNLGPAQEGVDFWRRAQAAGADVEAHTITHPDLKTLGVERQRREVCGLQDTFEELFGRRPTLFRPPFGNYNDSVRRVAASCGFRAVVMWKGSTNGGALTMQEGKLQPGDIILMHWRDDLVENLADVVARVRAEGFKIARLEDYLG